jgi:hypothetical protein
MLTVLMLASSVGGAQETQYLLNGRVSTPLGAMIEGGAMLKLTDEPEGFAGPAVTAGAGGGGVQVTAGYRLVGMMGLNGAVHGVLARIRDERDPGDASDPDVEKSLYAGAEIRGGILFGSLGLGVLARVSPERPGNRAMRMVASIGIGF